VSTNAGMGGFDVSLIDLTAVIPIRWIDESTSTLSSHILEALESGIEVILVVNNQEVLKREKVISVYKSIQHVKFRIFDCPIESPGYARNLGLSSCNTRYVTFWDADDLPVIPKVQELTKLLESNPDWKFGVGSFAIVDAKTKKVKSRNILQSEPELESRISRNPGIWRWIIEVHRIGQVSFKEFPMGEDQDFIADLNPLRSEMLVSSEVTYKYVKGWANQLTRNKTTLHSITASIRYLTTKIDEKTANKWHKKFLFRQVITSMRHGSWRSRIETLQIIARLIRVNAE